MASSVSGSETSSSESEEPTWVLARKGIELLVNNKGKEAEKLFLEHQESLPMYAGYAIVTFMDALMTFEEDKLELAMSVLKDVEKRCTGDKGWFRSMKFKVFGADSADALVQYLENQIILADSLVFLSTLTFLQQDLSGYFKGGWILRKSWKLYQSTYTEISKLYKEIIQNPNLPESVDSSNSPQINYSDIIDENMSIENESKDMPASINGYRPSTSYTHPIKTHPKESYSCHSNLSSLINNDNPTCDIAQKNSSKKHRGLSNGYTKEHLNKQGVYKEDLQSPTTTSFVGKIDSLKKSLSFNSGLSAHVERNRYSNISLSYFTSTFNIFTSTEKLKATDIDKETITRLMGAVCFGYGLFQLGVSLLPPALLKITNILGFSGNRQIGIENLMFARLGTDMRAPLATLALLWYHTIVRPFYALDGNNVQAGVESATQLIEEADSKYNESSLFLFFKGRVDRLKSDIPAALENFQKSVDNATQREMKILAKHELGWCYLIQLEFNQAESTFLYMRNCSRWSRSFYAYLTIISAGTYNNFKEYTHLEQLRDILENATKTTQLEEFLLRRYRICPNSASDLIAMNSTFWRLLVYELLYLWNTLPSCNPENINRILAECELLTEEVMVGLGKLLAGVCYCIQGNLESGIKTLRICLDLRKALPNNAPDAHISAFAQYELALLLIRNEETKPEGKLLLQQINEYKDYDFEQRLSVRIHMILKQL